MVRQLTWLALANSLNMSRASAAANAKIRFLCTVIRSLLGTLRTERGSPQLQPNERVHRFLLVLAGLCRPAWVTCDLSATHCRDNSPKRQGAALLGKHLVLGTCLGTAAQTVARAQWTSEDEAEEPLLCSQGRSLCLPSDTGGLALADIVFAPFIL